MALSGTAIVKAALAVADADGLDAVSMRRVAEELDTGASALYVYVDNRDDLLDAMFDHIMAGVALADLPAGDWRQRLAWLLLQAITAASGHVTAAALDRVPAPTTTPEHHRQRLRWEVDVILNGLTVTRLTVTGEAGSQA